LYLTFCCCAAGINNKAGDEKQIAERIWQLVQIFLTGKTQKKKAFPPGNAFFFCAFLKTSIENLAVTPPAVYPE
jgi:hypothetical protein